MGMLTLVGIATVWFIAGFVAVLAVANNPEWRVSRWLDDVEAATQHWPKWGRNLRFGVFVFVTLGPLGLLLSVFTNGWEGDGG